MSSATTKFKSALWGTARLLGIDPSTQQLSTNIAARITEYLNRRLEEGWRFEFWSQWTVVESRYYRPVWDSSTNYTAGDQVFHIYSGKYYQAVRDNVNQWPEDGAGNLNSDEWAYLARSYEAENWIVAGQAYAAGDLVYYWGDGGDDGYYQCHTAHTSAGSWDATKWGVLVPFNKYVAWEQTGATVISELPRKGVSQRDPRVYSEKPGWLNWWRSALGVQVDPNAPVQVWLTFRPPPPVFDSTPYDASTSYNTGDTVYRSTTGECYVSLQSGHSGQTPESSPTYWEQVLFPEILRSFAERAAYSDLLRDQKNQARANNELRQAYEELQDAVDRDRDSQGLYESAGVVTYGT